MFILIFYLFLVLDPRLKLTYHKDHNWEEEFITEARKVINDIYETRYAPRIDQSVQENITTDDDLLSHIYKKQRLSRNESELDLYLGSPVIPGDVNLLQWWKVNNFINKLYNLSLNFLSCFIIG